MGNIPYPDEDTAMTKKQHAENGGQQAQIFLSLKNLRGALTFNLKSFIIHFRKKCSKQNLVRKGFCL